MIAATLGVAAPGTHTYVVAPSGSDGADGSAAHPWRTLQRAVDTAGPGDTIQLRAGTYAGASLTRSGTPGSPITITAWPGEAPVVAGDGAHSKVIRVAGAHDVVIAGLVVRGAPTQWGAGVSVENGAAAVDIRDNVIRSNRSFGALLQGVDDVTIERNEITDNDTGIEVSGAGEGVRIVANRIFANDHMVVNTPAPGGDRGANGVVLYRTTGHLLVTDNEIYGNRAKSYDYGYDGGAFEIYAASNATITGNTLWDNQNVLETGTDGAACSNNTFTRNLAYAGRGAAPIAGPIEGLILRCATRMLVANNTLVGLERFTFDITASGAFAGGIDSLRVCNNIAQSTGDKVFSIDSSMPASVSIDRDLVQNGAGGAIAWVAGRGTTGSLATFSNWTGFERAGIQANPRFAAGTFQLTSRSPALDHGVVLAGVTDGFAGSAPDIGRFELGATSGSGAVVSSIAPGAGSSGALTPATAAPTAPRTVIVGETSPRIAYAGRWWAAYASGYLGGAVSASRQAGATASLVFAGRAVRVFGPRGPGRGRASLLIDGHLVGTVNLSASRFVARTLLFRWTAPAPGRHRATLRVLASSGRVVALDAFVVST